MRRVACVVATGWLPSAVLIVIAGCTGAPPAWAQETQVISELGGIDSPPITAVAISSPHELPEVRVRAAVGDLTGRPFSRAGVRDSLERLWALQLFSDVRVEEERAPGGVRLRYHLVRRPWVEQVDFTGDLEIDVAMLASAAGLAIGGDATAERLERARQALLGRYAREGFLDARVDVETRADARTNGRAVAFHVQAGERVRVGAVRVRGTARLSAGTIRSLLAVDEGDRYRADEVRDAVDALTRALRDRGFFEARVDVAETREHPGSRRVHLDLAVHEGPHVRIELEGVTALAQAALRKRLTFADTGVVDDLEVRASARQIEAAYREQGYAFAKVSGTTTREREDVVVRFLVREGPRVRVGAVELTGDTGLPPARLRERIDTRPSRVRDRGLYRPEQLDRDLLLLRGYLESVGFADARVGRPEVTLSEDRSQARIVIPVSAGPRVTIGTVDVEGQAVLTREEILQRLALAPGMWWSRAAADEARRALERQYERRGHHAAEVRYETRRRDHVVDIVYLVREGEPTRVGRVLVEGLVYTRPDVVRRELPFSAGDVFDPDALVEAQRRLSALGAFDRVEVDPLRPPAVPFADVRVGVRERRPWHVDLGVGYATFEGPRGFVELGHDNLLGTARTATLRHRISERGDRTDLTYGEPRVFGTLWQGSADLFRERRQELGFRSERYGTAVAVQRELVPEHVRGLRAVVRYDLSQLERFDVDPTLAAADVTRGRERIAALTPELTLERRDRPLDPTRGGFHLVSLRTGGLVFGGDADFLKSRLETHWFFDWLRPTVVAFSARLGLAGALLESATLPIEERFQAGGSTTVRGYRENRLGPLDDKGNPTGGNALAVFNAEWRFPVWRWIGGAAFFDTGALASEVERLGPEDFKSGVGVGLRLSTPVGPLRLDVGYPLDTVRRHDREPRVYLSVGHAF
ncbi:MAG: outer membrane protein assembly factor BamA [Candidatus Rokubacteria bacterium]|nr:outer membrane protein assembly factor BamA [Candidatus Rokubacteria bacterium]